MGGRHSHGVLLRDSHEISPTMGGCVHRLMILRRDLVKEKIRKHFGEEMGGQGDPDPLMVSADARHTAGDFLSGGPGGQPLGVTGGVLRRP